VAFRGKLIPRARSNSKIALAACARRDLPDRHLSQDITSALIGPFVLGPARISNSHWVGFTVATMGTEFLDRMTVSRFRDVEEILHRETIFSSAPIRRA